MKVLTDETGAFESIEAGDFGVVTLVTISDNEVPRLEEFLNSLFPDGFENVKGKNISDEDREKVLKYIGKKQEIKYTAVILDSSLVSKESVKRHQAMQSAKFDEWLEKFGDVAQPTLKRDIEVLRNQMRNLSRSDYLKFMIVNSVYRYWVEFFQFDYVFMDVKNDSWVFEHIIDTQNAPGRFKNLFYGFLMGTTNNTLDFKIACPEEWPADHPMNRDYSEKGRGFRADKLFKNRAISSEQEEPLLLLPDLIGNTIFRSIHQQTPYWLKLLKRIKPNRSMSMTLKNKHGYYVINGFGDVNDATDKKIKSHYKKMIALK
jgi:hypothetical protein